MPMKLVCYACALLLGWTTPAIAQEDFPRGIIGLVDLPQIYADDCGACVSHEVALFGSATSHVSIGKIYVATPWTHSVHGGFEGLVVRVALAGRPDREAPRTLEYEYEQPAVVALERRDDRIKIALARGSAWIELRPPMSFMSVETVLPGKMLWFRPSATLLARRSPSGPRADDPTGWSGAELIGAVRQNDLLWLHLRRAASDCAGEGARPQRQEVWLPFLDADHKPTVWFYARGC
jgi:hypothetical protein